MHERSWVIRWVRAHPFAVDVAVAVMLTAVNLAGLGYRSYAGVTFRDPDFWGVLLNVLSGLPLAFRRRFPAMVGVVVFGSYLALGFLDYSSFGGSLAALLALYTLGAYARPLVGLVLTAASLVSSFGYVYAKRDVFAAADMPVDAWTITSMTIVYVGAYVIGRTVRTRRMYLAELEDRAERLERASAAEVRAALAEERARVARDLHDVVAHHVSVMTVQAAAARRTVDRDPDRSVEAMRAVEETGREALMEMRRIVGALRTADTDGVAKPGEMSPNAGVGELDPLLDRAREAGLDVELAVVGGPRSLPPGVDLAIFRVVQEALTNTLRHAGPTRAAVLLRYETDAVIVAVTDDGTRRRSAWHRTAEPERPGHGILGMRERVALNGGTLRTGPRSVGGFEVHARLPLERVTT